jgi:hypothetical protein
VHLDTSTIAAIIAGIAAIMSAGGALGLWIEGRTQRKISAAQLEVLRCQDFNKAAAEFRAQFIAAEFRIRRSLDANLEDVFRILTDNVIENHEMAKIAFEPYLSEAERTGLEAAWRAYTDPNWVPTAAPGSMDRRNRELQEAMKRIDVVLAFAKPK